jgi:hypothetical protein
VQVTGADASDPKIVSSTSEMILVAACWRYCFPFVASSRSEPKAQGEAEVGFEPGLADLQSAKGLSQPGDPSTTSDKGDSRRVRTLRFPPGFDPDLQRILDAWPQLPPPIRTAMLALAGTTVPTGPETATRRTL